VTRAARSAEASASLTPYPTNHLRSLGEVLKVKLPDLVASQLGLTNDQAG